MVQDPGDLIRKQARIDRVVNGANAGDAIPGFHMAPSIPGERGDTVTQLDAIALKALGNTQRAQPHITVIRVMEGAFHGTADDLPPRMLDGGVVQDLVHQQGPILHQSKHGFPLYLGVLRPSFSGNPTRKAPACGKMAYQPRNRSPRHAPRTRCQPEG